MFSLFFVNSRMPFSRLQKAVRCLLENLFGREFPALFEKPLHGIELREVGRQKVDRPVLVMKKGTLMKGRIIPDDDGWQTLCEVCRFVEKKDCGGQGIDLVKSASEIAHCSLLNAHWNWRFSFSKW